MSDNDPRGRINSGNEAAEVRFGRTAGDYARHRAGFPDDLYGRLARYGLGEPGLKTLDLGTGTGSLGRLFARYGAVVVGLDPAPELLGQARRLDAAESLATPYAAGRAGETVRQSASKRLRDVPASRPARFS